MTAFRSGVGGSVRCRSQVDVDVAGRGVDADLDVGAGLADDPAVAQVGDVAGRAAVGRTCGRSPCDTRSWASVRLVRRRGGSVRSARRRPRCRWCTKRTRPPAASGSIGRVGGRKLSRCRRSAMPASLPDLGRGVEHRTGTARPGVALTPVGALPVEPIDGAAPPRAAVRPGRCRWSSTGSPS